jgi:hypothetical protein
MSRRSVTLGALLLFALPAWAGQVAILTDANPAAPAQHGLQKLDESLRANGFTVVNSAAQADYVILAGSPALAALKSWKAPCPRAPKRSRFGAAVIRANPPPRSRAQTRAA